MHPRSALLFDFGKASRKCVLWGQFLIASKEFRWKGDLLAKSKLTFTHADGNFDDNRRCPQIPPFAAIKIKWKGLMIVFFIAEIKQEARTRDDIQFDDSKFAFFREIVFQMMKYVASLRTVLHSGTTDTTLGVSLVNFDFVPRYSGRRRNCYSSQALSAPDRLAP